MNFSQALISMIFIISSVVNAAALQTSKFSPPGFYNIKSIALENGLEIYLREKHDDKSISIC